ncbi:hypothetical protein F0562_003793 [Nyssa sinensis]|uniref:Uncharacterized protein n=1 Tax=Nyssa sinensis TaxID=561372 RepID=A0A5J5BW47_9ASTE|nr:hypothetical protein F0562_003793 [Nyssa sinensis]
MDATKMLLLSPASTSLPALHRNSCKVFYRRIGSNAPLKVLGMAKESSESGDGGTVEKVAIVSGLVSTPVIGWSLYTLKTTGCGLPPGPGGSIGALEGVSYLVVVGIVAWSLYTKSKTGSGLPNGPFGLLGAVEGLSYLSLLAIVVVFGLQFFQQEEALNALIRKSSEGEASFSSSNDDQGGVSAIRVMSALAQEEKKAEVPNRKGKKKKVGVRYVNMEIGGKTI